MAGPPKERKFEDELGDLEEIVSRIDSGELSLEESIAAFERGVALVRSLNHRLDEIERKVEVLIKTAQGELRSVPLEGEVSGGATSPAEGGSGSSGHTDKDDDPPS